MILTGLSWTGPLAYFDETPGDDWIPCCLGSAANGPAHCTCWEPEYDKIQAAAQAGEQPTMAAMCHDCAYRPDSPERQSDEADNLLDLPYGDRPFICHQGMRRIVAWKHPDGRRIVSGPGDYQPQFNDRGYACKADGTPAAICEGWRRLHVHVTK